jgi:hypothetical protein
MTGFTVLMAIGMAKANLIENGGFENGTLPPWEERMGEVTVESRNFMGLFSPCEGNHMAVLSPDTESSSALVYTGIGPCSGPLRLSFYYNLVAFNEGSTPVSDYAELYFNGTPIASAVLEDPLGGSYSDTGWCLASLIVTPQSVEGSWLGFALWNDELCDGGSPDQRAMVLLDDVRLEAIPDAGSTGLLLAAAVGLLLPARFRRRPRLGC